MRACLTLQRHFRASATFVHVESRFCGCKQQGEAAFCPSINPCVRRVCSKSVAVGIIEEMGPRFAASKTVVEGRLKLPQFLHKPFDITGDNLKCGQSKSFAGSPTDW